MTVSTRRRCAALLVGLVTAAVAPASATAESGWRPIVIGGSQDAILRFPQAVAFDASGVRDPDADAPPGPYLYVADQHSFFVQKFTADGRFVRRFGGYGSGPGRFGSTTASASPTTGTVGGIGGVAVDARGHVLVLDSSNARIERFSPGGAFESQFGTFGSDPGELNPGINGGSGPGQFTNPYDAGVDLTGRLFVADNQNHRVVRLDATTLAYQTWFGGGPSDEPGKLANLRGIAVAPGADAGGGVFATDTSINQIAEFGTDGAFIRGWGRDGRGDGTFMQPRDVAVEANGDIVVVDTRADRVQVLRAGGAVESWARVSATLHRPVGGGGNREFRDPTGVAVDPRNGDVYVVEGGNHRIQRISQDGTWLKTWGGTSAGTELGEFTEPLGVDVAPDGTVWVADTRNDRLQRLDTATGAWTAITGLHRPTAVAVLPDGRLAVTELGADPRVDPQQAVGIGRLVVLEPDGTPVAARAGLDRPEGVEPDPDGGVLVADTQRDRIVRLRLRRGRLVEVGQIGGPGLGTGRFARPMASRRSPRATS